MELDGTHHEKRCPRCAQEIPDRIEGRQDYQCKVCKAQYRVLEDPGTGRSLLVDVAGEARVEPLGMPAGSIRALMALALSGALAAIALTGRPTPEALTSLLLTVVGFYFGMRARRTRPADDVHNPTAWSEQPLWLPGGTVRFLLIAALAVAAVTLLARNRNEELQRHGPFFLVVAGLIVGHFVKKIVVASAGGWPAWALHLKGAAGLLAAAILAAVFVLGPAGDHVTKLIAALSALVSFYYGSR